MKRALVIMLLLVAAVTFTAPVVMADDWKYENGMVTDGMMAFPDFEMMLLYHYGRKLITHWGMDLLIGVVDSVQHPGVVLFTPSSDPDFWGVD